MLELKPNFETVMEGVQARRLANGFAHLRIHYLADPLKRGDWADRAAVFYGGKESPTWQREMEINYKAFCGQRIWLCACDLHNEQYDLSKWTIYRVIDQGIRHPTVCLWIAVNEKKDRHVFREYYSTGMSIAENCRNILRIDAGENIAGNFIDPATKKRNEINLTAISQIYGENGINCEYADNSFAGYDTVNQMLISTLARKWLSGMRVPYIDNLKASKTQIYMLADKPALTFDFRFTPKCWTELCGLRWQQSNVDPTQKAQTEKPVDVYDDGPDCFSEDTEVLTNNGWKYFKDLNYNDETLTVNLENDTFEYQRPTEYFEKEYDSKMIKLSNQKGEFLVTPNHRMIAYKHTHTGMSKNHTIKLAKDLLKSDTLKLISNWKGKSYKKIFGEDAGDFAEFLGWYISEGCCCINDTKIPNRGYQITISQKKGAKYERIYELCSSFRWKWYRCKNGICTSSKELWEYLKSFGNRAWNKQIPEVIKMATPEIINRFLDSYCSGDGWIHKGHRYWATTSKDSADGLQELIIKIGGSASIRERKEGIWNIRGKSGKTRRQYSLCERSQIGFGLVARYKHGGIEKIDYNGKVYCVSVPNGTLVIRRNGSPIIAGNCVRYGCQSPLVFRGGSAKKNLTILEIMELHQKQKENDSLMDKRHRRAYA